MTASKFELRLQHCPNEWKTPIAEVADTVDTLHLLLEEKGIKDSQLLATLVRLVFERRYGSAA
tara:strand:- start:781 stop:969 length:189 start_codon:yes stop_codon:yes gene_type:complete